MLSLNEKYRTTTAPTHSSPKTKIVTVPLFTSWEKMPDKMIFSFNCEQGEKIATAAYTVLAAKNEVSLGGKPAISHEGNKIIFSAAAQTAGYIDQFFNLYEAKEDKAKFANFKSEFKQPTKPSLYKTHSELLKKNIMFSASIEEKTSPSQPRPPIRASRSSLLPLPPLPSASIDSGSLKKKIFNITAENSKKLLDYIAASPRIEFSYSEKLSILRLLYQQYVETNNLIFQNNILTIVISLFSNLTIAPNTFQQDLEIQFLYHLFIKKFYLSEVVVGIREILIQISNFPKIAIDLVLDYYKSYSENFSEDFIESIIDKIYQVKREFTTSLSDLKVAEQPEEFGVCAAYAAFNHLLPGILTLGDQTMFDWLFASEKKVSSSHPREQLVHLFISKAADFKQGEEDISPAQMIKLFSDNLHPFPQLIKGMVDFNQVSADTLIPIKIEGEKLEIGSGAPIFQLKMITNIVKLFTRLNNGMPIAYSFLVYFNNQHWLSVTWIAQKDKVDSWLITDSTSEHKNWHKNICITIRELFYNLSALKKQIKIITQQINKEFIFLSQDKTVITFPILQVEVLVELWQALAAHPPLQSCINRMNFAEIEELVCSNTAPMLLALNSKLQEIRSAIIDTDLKTLITEALELKDKIRSRNFYRVKFREITIKSAEEYGIGHAILKPLAEKTTTAEFKQKIAKFFEKNLYNKPLPVYEIENKQCIIEINSLFDHLKNLCAAVGYDSAGIATVQERLTNPAHYPFKKAIDKKNFYKDLKWQLEVILFSFYQARQELPGTQQADAKSLLNLRIATYITLGHFLKTWNTLPDTSGLCSESYSFVHDIFYNLNRIDELDKEISEFCESCLYKFTTSLAQSYLSTRYLEGKHIETNAKRIAADCGLPIPAASFADENLESYEVEIHIRSYIANSFFEEFNRESILLIMYNQLRKKFFSEIAEFSHLKLDSELIKWLQKKLTVFIDSGFFELYGAPRQKNSLVFTMENNQYILNPGLKEDDVEFELRLFHYVYSQAIFSQRILPLKSLSKSNIDDMLSQKNFYSLMSALLTDQKTEVTASKSDIFHLLRKSFLLSNVNDDAKPDPALSRRNTLLSKIIINFMRHKNYYLSPEAGFSLLSEMITLVKTEKNYPLLNDVFEVLSLSTNSSDFAAWNKLLKDKPSLWKNILSSQSTTTILKFLLTFPCLTHEIAEWKHIIATQKIPLSPLLSILEELRIKSDLKREAWREQMVKLRKNLSGQIPPDKLFKIISLQISQKNAINFFSAYEETSVDIEELLEISSYTSIDLNKPRCFETKESKQLTTPLLWALQQNHFDQFQRLLTAGADPAIIVNNNSCFMFTVKESVNLAAFHQLLPHLHQHLQEVSAEKLFDHYVLPAAQSGLEKLIALLSHIFIPEKVLKMKKKNLPENLLSLLTVITDLRQENYSSVLSHLPKPFNLNLLQAVFRQCQKSQSQACLRTLINSEENNANLCVLLEFYQQNVENKNYEPAVFNLNSPRKNKIPLLAAMEEKNSQSRTQQIKILLKSGAHVSIADEKGMRPLNKALYIKLPIHQLAALKILLNSQTKPAMDWFEPFLPAGKSLLVEAAELKNSNSTLELILTSFMKSDIKEERRSELLIEALKAAIKNDHIPYVNKLMQLIPEKRRKALEKESGSIGSLFPLGSISPLPALYKEEKFIEIKFPAAITVSENLITCEFNYPNGEIMASALYAILEKHPKKPKTAQAIIYTEDQPQMLKFSKINAVFFKELFNFYKLDKTQLSLLDQFFKNFSNSSLKDLIAASPAGVRLPRAIKINDTKTIKTSKLVTSTLYFPAGFIYNFENKNVIFQYSKWQSNRSYEMYLYLQNIFPEFKKNKNYIFYADNSLMLSFAACKAGYLAKFLQLFKANTVTYTKQVTAFTQKVIAAIDHSQPTEYASATWTADFQALAKVDHSAEIKVEKELILTKSTDIRDKDRYELSANEIKFPDKCDFSNSQANFIFSHHSGDRMAYTIYKRLKKECKFDLEFEKIVTAKANTISFTAIACKRGYLDKFFELFSYGIQADVAAAYICVQGATAENFFPSFGENRQERCTNAFFKILQNIKSVSYLDDGKILLDKSIASFY